MLYPNAQNAIEWHLNNCEKETSEIDANLKQARIARWLLVNAPKAEFWGNFIEDYYSYAEENCIDECYNRELVDNLSNTNIEKYSELIRYFILKNKHTFVKVQIQIQE